MGINRKIIKRLILTIIKLLLLPPGIIYSCFHQNPQISILMYHRVNNRVEKELSVKVNNFKWQMNYLKKKGYRVISLDQALIMADTPPKLNKYVVLTFDDGYLDYYTSAYPILSSYNYPSIIFLIPGVIGTNQVFWWDRDIGESSLMDWDHICKLKKDPLIYFGSHTMTHPDLNMIESYDVIKELCLSREILEKKLSRPIHHLAYPRGIIPDELLPLIENYYKSGLCIFKGFEITDQHFSSLLIKRIPIQRSDNRLLFIARLKRWLIAEEWLRKAIEYGRHSICNKTSLKLI